MPKAANTPPDFVDDYLAYLLARASHLISAQFHSQLARQQLSVLQWRVLATLSGGTPITMGELANRVLSKQPTLTKLVIRMEALGWLQRSQNPQDLRHALVHITPQGATKVQPLLQQAKAHEQQVLSRMGEQDAATLKLALQGIIADYGANSASNT